MGTSVLRRLALDRLGSGARGGGGRSLSESALARLCLASRRLFRSGVGAIAPGRTLYINTYIHVKGVAEFVLFGL